MDGETPKKDEGGNPWQVRFAAIVREHDSALDFVEEAQALERARPYVVDEASFRAAMAAACAWGDEELDPVCAEVRGVLPAHGLRLVRRGFAVVLPAGEAYPSMDDAHRAADALERAAEAVGGYSWGTVRPEEGGYRGMVVFDGGTAGRAAERPGDPRLDDQLVQELAAALDRTLAGGR
jgi:hypothetical protein